MACASEMRPRVDSFSDLGKLSISDINRLISNKRLQLLRQHIGDKRELYFALEVLEDLQQEISYQISKVII